MPVERYTVSLRDGLWEVWLDGRLIAGQPSEVGAVGLAEALSDAAAPVAVGSRSPAGAGPGVAARQDRRGGQTLTTAARSIAALRSFRGCRRRRSVTT